MRRAAGHAFAIDHIKITDHRLGVSLEFMLRPFATAHARSLAKPYPILAIPKNPTTHGQGVAPTLSTTV